MPGDIKTLKDAIIKAAETAAEGITTRPWGKDVVVQGHINDAGWEVYHAVKTAADTKEATVEDLIKAAETAAEGITTRPWGKDVVVQGHINDAGWEVYHAVKTAADTKEAEEEK